MSFVAVFTASAMGFTLLVPILMVAVLLAYAAPRRPARVRSESRRQEAERERDVTRIAV